MWLSFHNSPLKKIRHSIKKDRALFFLPVLDNSTRLFDSRRVQAISESMIIYMKCDNINMFALFRQGSANLFKKIDIIWYCSAIRISFCHQVDASYEPFGQEYVTTNLAMAVNRLNKCCGQSSFILLLAKLVCPEPPVPGSFKSCIHEKKCQLHQRPWTAIIALVMYYSVHSPSRDSFVHVDKCLVKNW
jgi:hypothetical protein